MARCSMDVIEVVDLRERLSWSSDAHFVLPQLIRLDQQIQDGDELSQAGDNRNLGLRAGHFRKI